MHLTRKAAIATIAIASLALTACAATTDESSSSSGDDILVYAAGEPDHLAPGRQTVAFGQVMSLFAPLVSLDADNNIGFDAQAESVESDDSTTWTITLKDGWTFHNGETVTSASYVDAWNYTADPDNAWENAGFLANIVGFDEMNPAEGVEPTAETLSGLEIVDDTTFTVTLVGPDSQFPLQLTSAQTAFYPMPEAAYDDIEAYDRQPIGNGPYEMLEAWVDDEEFTVTPYADYQGPEVKNGGITWRAYADAVTGYTDVLAGNADVQFLPTTKMTSAAADFGDRLYSFEAPGVDYIGFPLWDEKWQNQDLREAISMAIDREAVNEAIYGGLYEPANSLTAPGMAGDPAGICGELCEFDPDAAKEKLAAAGGYEGTLEIVYPGGSGLDELFEAYANQIRQNLEIEDVVATPTTDWAEYWQSLVDNTVAGPHFGHWGALYPSMQDTLRNLFTENGGCYLCTGYSDAEVVDLLNEANSSATLEDSYDGYVAVQERVLEDFPTVPTFSNNYSYVTSEKIKNLPAVMGSPVVDQIELN